MRETDVRRKVIAELKKNDWFIMSMSDKFASGYPDLLCIKHPRYVFIELKCPVKGVLSKIQIAYHNKLRSLGCEVHVIKSVEELKEAKIC